MSGRDPLCPPHRARQGATLTLVFAGVLVAGALTGAFPEADHPARRTTTVPVGAVRDEDVREAAARAMADGTSPMEAAERAVSRSGDRWGAVYSEGEYQEFQDALDGRYTGVGLSAARGQDGRIEVTGVRPGSPAAAAGVRTGDRLRSVDGARADGLPVTEVVSRLRGDADDAPAGTTVTLGLQRGARAWTETLRRTTLTTDSVTVRRLSGHATLIRIASFTRGTGARVREALRASPADGGTVLDLRGNSGGLVTEAVATASALLDGGLVATYDVDGAQRALHATPGGDTARPLVVLVDGGTMSAAELLTGALQDRGRAVVIGSRTFGKGSIQMPTRLPDGSVAELTVGHYRTPCGHAVDGRGITPDLEAGDGVLRRAEAVLTGLGDAD
ncbi:S41 family peptidase [Streptomyces hygroscopicus]|uniref:S41 family peptidase n=1 Tax=Streptomyces sp. KHY 26 TaxID=3097359 RepID=UPI00255622D1|nr:S41 family peptidase [Streptomyces hygroscopicus]